MTDCRTWWALLPAGACAALLLTVGGPGGAQGEPPEMRMTPVDFPTRGDDAVRLEGRLLVPTGTAGRLPAAVVCHPDPRRSGTMYDAVVAAVVDELVRRGFAALIFNFRGVGGSTGEFAGGVGEVADTLGALDFLAQQQQADPERLFLGGYSFGSVMALKAAARDDRVKGWAGVSFPFGSRTKDPGEYDWVREVRPLPLMFISGDRDEYSDLERIRGVTGDRQPPPNFLLVEGADHFWPLAPSLLEQAAVAAAEFLRSPAEPAAAEA